MEMQSTGQGGTQSSQPVQSAAITVCMSLRAPMMASTGQASMHFRQPMQDPSSIIARVRRWCFPHSGSSDFGGTASSRASAAMVTPSPGGHRLIAALPAAMASA
jgi:hypothetical protein